MRLLTRTRIRSLPVTLVTVILWSTHVLAQQQRELPTPNKTVVVFEENKSYRQIIGSPHAPYINELAREGALITQAYAVAHPSQPNYIALLSGSLEGVWIDFCAASPIRRPNLASALFEKYGASGFVSYAEGLPSVGFTGCTARNGYARKHNPVVNWQGTGFPGAVPASLNLPFDAFPKDFSRLPAVSYVIPNIDNDMHDGRTDEAISRGDTWLRNNLSGYVEWARQNNSLLIVIWDEDSGGERNHIPLIFVGPMVKAGATSSERVDHYGVLRTILDLYRLEPIGEAKNREPIGAIWTTSK